MLENTLNTKPKLLYLISNLNILERVIYPSSRKLSFWHECGVDKKEQHLFLVTSIRFYENALKKKNQCNFIKFDQLKNIRVFFS